MQDIAPELYEAVRTAFTDKVIADPYVFAFMEKVDRVTADFPDAQVYAKRLGEMLSDALLDVLTEDSLPDGRLYWNIADRVIRPMLNQNYELVNQAAAEVQKVLDSAERIGLNAVRAAKPEKRIKGLLDNMTVEGLEFSEVQRRMTAPVVNITESFFDDFIRENANFRYQSGMNPQIIRILTGKKPCSWCKSLAGVYDYENTWVSDDYTIYQRHENCHCQVFYKNNRERYLQGVHSKRIVREPSDIDTRITLNLDVTRKKG